MKNGIFTLLLVTLFLGLNGCATFLDFGGEEELAADRGYAEETEESDEDGLCSGRYCHTETAKVEDDGSEFEGDHRVRRAIQARDVVLGMTREEVANSWGEPVQRDLAGTGKRGHERWIYGSQYSLNGSRVVIFENGRVAGWYR